jgi:hypothetical protein
MAVGGLIRLSYGLAALLAPRWVAGRLAAVERDSVMNLRGFGGQNVAVGAFTVLASRSPDLARPVLLLNAGLEVCDATAGSLEIREKGTDDPIAMGGVVLPLVSLMLWLAALATIER